MKTNKFENTIRQKLESIEPDFQEADWTKMQSFMQVHTPPTFWQQYGSWLGYAAAASLSTVMAFMYVNQLSETKTLVSDVKKLQSQIEVIRNTPAAASKTDTVYILQQLAKDQLADQNAQNTNASTSDEVNVPVKDSNEEPEIINQKKTGPNVYIKAVDGPLVADKDENKSKPDSEDLLKEKRELADNGKVVDEKTTVTYRDAQPSESVNSDVLKNKPNVNVASNQSGKEVGEVVSNYDHSENNRQMGVGTNGGIPALPAAGKALDENFDQVAELNAGQLKNNSRQMDYALANRLTSKEVKKALIASAPALTPAKPIVENKKVEQVAKADNVIPKLNIRAPYRFGAAMQFEGKNQVKTVMGEVLVAKKFSISAGVSWLKIKPMEFLSEKIFRVKNGQDFKKSHPNQVPKALEIMNIGIRPTLVQIPLTVAFRNDLKDNFSYFVSAGTNVTVKGREQFSFDCRLPSTYPNPHQEIFSQTFERKMDIPVINSVNFSAGIEKRWHPVVVQVEGYVYNYLKPISVNSPRTGPGVKLKLLYQIGGKM